MNLINRFLWTAGEGETQLSEAGEAHNEQTEEGEQDTGTAREEEEEEDLTELQIAPNTDAVVGLNVFEWLWLFHISAINLIIEKKGFFPPIPIEPPVLKNFHKYW